MGPGAQSPRDPQGPVGIRPLLLLAGLALSGLGCGKDQHVRCFPVKGSVSVNGKPAVKAQVVFHPAKDAGANAPRATGEVGADGTFTLSTYTAGDGAPAGDYVVTVTWPEGSSAIGGDADSGPDRLGGRYSNPKTSTLRATVNEAPTELPPFRLK